MIMTSRYRTAFIGALLFHFLLGFLLLAEFSSSRPVLINEKKNEPGELMAIEQQPAKPEIVKAVSIDNKELMATVSRLKQERAQQVKAEQQRQQTLAKQVEMARRERVLEQQHLAKLKVEEAKLALARKKAMEEEKKHLQQLALQKQQEAKQLEELKVKQQAIEKQRQQETEKLAQIKKNQLDEKIKEEKAHAIKEAADLAHQRELAAQAQAAADANRAKMAGEVNKYKALIVNAISRHWILPENIDKNLSSQFRIRLAPDGAVLEVSLTRSSGDTILDRSAQHAIYKASPLPVPNDPVTFDLFRDISLTVRPENVRG